MDGSKPIAVRSAADDYVVKAEVVRVGDDVLVRIWGGEKPHIGAVAAALPRPSLADASRTSATTSVLAFPGHKEDLVARDAAKRLASALGNTVVVTAGIHWDDLSAEGIKAVQSHCGEIVTMLIERLA